MRWGGGGVSSRAASPGIIDVASTVGVTLP